MNKILYVLSVIFWFLVTVFGIWCVVSYIDILMNNLSADGEMHVWNIVRLLM